MANSIDARELLNNKVFKNIVKELEAELFDAWATTVDLDARELIWSRCSTLRIMVEYIEYEANNIIAPDQFPKPKAIGA